MTTTWGFFGFGRWGGSFQQDVIPVPIVTVNVTPDTVTMQTSTTQQFTATVGGNSNTTVNWYVDGVSGGNSTVGTIDATGLYTAPASGGTHQIAAICIADNATQDISTVTVQAAPVVVSVAISPTSPSITTNASQQFVATVSGTSSTGVTWSVDGVPGGSGGGVAGPGGSATVNTLSCTVNAPIITSTSIEIQASSSDSTYSLTGWNLYVDGVNKYNTSTNISSIDQTVTGLSAGSHRVTVKAYNSHGDVAVVVLQVTLGTSIGTITPGGLYTAPASTGSHTITATSIADNTKSASATLTVVSSIAPLNFAYTLSQLAGHNTSAYSGYNKTKYPANFTGTTWTTQGGATAAVDNTKVDDSMNPITPGHVSNVDVHTLLPSHSTVRWFAHLCPWFNTSSTNHNQIGVTCNTTAWAQACVTDLINRGFNGLIVDWYGQGSYEDLVLLKLQTYIASIPNNTFKFIVQMDSGMLNHKNSGETNQAYVIRMIQYCQTQYFIDPNYETEGGKPILMFFDLNSQSGVDMGAAKTATGGNMYMVPKNYSSLANSWADGCQDWVHDWHTGVAASDPFNLAAIRDFYSHLGAYPTKKCFGTVTPGFNGTLTGTANNASRGTSWSKGKFLPRGYGLVGYSGSCWISQCNQTDTSLTSNATRIQVATWDDWEEGTQIEGGIENYIVVNLGNPSGGVVTWTISGGTGDETTIDHYEVYTTLDGTNYCFLGTVATGGAKSFTLTSVSGWLSAHSYQVNVKAVGKACVRDQWSNAVIYNT